MLPERDSAKRLLRFAIYPPLDTPRGLGRGYLFVARKRAGPQHWAVRHTIVPMTVFNPTAAPRPLARVLAIHGGEVKRIAARNGATNVRVVGSVARGEEREGSDIDLLVDFNPGRSLFDHAQLVEELTALLGVSVDVVSSRGLKPRVRERLLRDARPL